MTLEPSQLAADLTALLRETVVAQATEDQIALLTPAEFPDGACVSVLVQPLAEGEFAISDAGAADAYLAGSFGRTATRNRAIPIAGRFGAEFIDGHILGRASRGDLAEMCWQVALAAAAVAELRGEQEAGPAGETFASLVAGRLRYAGLDVQEGTSLVGWSGHRYTTSVYLPASETVIEPISGQRYFERAQRVFAEFSDLRKVNGYRGLAVLDDGQQPRDAEQLLSDVGQVAYWSRADEWIATLQEN